MPEPKNRSSAPQTWLDRRQHEKRLEGRLYRSLSSAYGPLRTQKKAMAKKAQEKQPTKGSAIYAAPMSKQVTNRARL